jgi:PPK2 family polyphosphate:nucleotide phosphotransferase
VGKKNKNVNMDYDISKYMASDSPEFSISNYNPDEWQEYEGGKEKSAEELDLLNKELSELQKVLWAEKRNRILIVLQGMDASGKDGAVKNVFSGVNPNGVRVAHFGAPTRKEMSRDYLWRIHREVPADGEIVVFNRSHYEDVLIVRVQQLMPESVWSKRYGHIREFEKLLHDEGTTVIKFYLQISFEEQTSRLQARIDNPDKHWKIEPNDFKDRKLWPQYIEAYNDALRYTHTEWAPWYVIPSNRKWYRNVIISRIIVERLKALNMNFPSAKADYTGMKLD